MKNAKRKTQAGFSLLELMISITIFLIVIAAIYGLLRVGTLDRNRASRRSDALKNARAALHLIGRDALNAGLGYTRYGASVPDDFLNSGLGFAADTNTKRDLLTSVVAGNERNTNTLQTEPTDMIAFIYRDVDFFGGKTISASNGGAVSSGSSTIRLTTNENISAAGNPAGTVVPAVNDLFLVEGGPRAIVMLTNIGSTNQMDFAIGDPLNLNQSAASNDPNKVSLLRKCVTGSVTENCMNYPVTLKRVFIVAYRINSNGTLVRTIYGNNRNDTSAAGQVQEQPIAYGVKNMQIRYTTKQGVTSNDPGIDINGNYTPEFLNDIRQVTISFITQDGFDDATGKPNYVTIDGTFSTRNLEYDAG